ncbi:MAG: sulfotransferase domain-containing protein [Anaerolineales bacterium]|nr:sulfotransferase domain-containing protein [Anaerolineales bacterium]
MQRGQIHLRGTVRWKTNRFRNILRYGKAEINRLPIIVGNAIPKSGSKLLFNMLRGFVEIGPFIDTTLMVIKPYTDGEPTNPAWIHKELRSLSPGDIRTGYFYATPDLREILSGPRIAHYFIVRDPRDALVSSIFFALDVNPDQFHHDFLMNLPDMEERLSFAIHGNAEGEFAMSNVGERYARWMGWLDNPDICLIRFEELVSDRETQSGIMLDYLENRGFTAKLSRNQMIDILKRQMAPEKSNTFRKGTSGEWRKYFSERNIEEFKKCTGDLLVKMGYEKSNNW